MVLSEMKGKRVTLSRDVRRGERSLSVTFSIDGLLVD